MVKLASSKTFVSRWLAMVFMVTIGILTLFFYNYIAPVLSLPLIPTSLPDWRITAPYGLILLLPLWKVRYSLFALLGASVIAGGWIVNTTLFTRVNGGGLVGYEILSAISLHWWQTVGIALVYFIARGYHADTRPLVRMGIMSLLMVGFGALISVFAEPVGEVTLLVNTKDYFWWFLASNLIFLGMATAIWTEFRDPKQTGTKNSQTPEIREEPRERRAA